MRPWFLLVCLPSVFLVPPRLVAADPPVPWDVGVSVPPPGMPNVPPPPPPVEWPRAVGPQLIDVEFLLGFPTEVRLQGAVYRGQNNAFLLEGIAGIEVIPLYWLFAVPFVGAGGRLRHACCNGERNAFVVEPGLDVYGVPVGRGLLAGGADVELLWYHNCGRRNRFGFELGVDLGAFFGDNGPGFWGWPMVSGIFGLHF